MSASIKRTTGNNGKEKKAALHRAAANIRNTITGPDTERALISHAINFVAPYYRDSYAILPTHLFYRHPELQGQKFAFTPGQIAELPTFAEVRKACIRLRSALYESQIKASSQIHLVTGFRQSRKELVAATQKVAAVSRRIVKSIPLEQSFSGKGIASDHGIPLTHDYSIHVLLPLLLARGETLNRPGKLPRLIQFFPRRTLKAFNIKVAQTILGY